MYLYFETSTKVSDEPLTWKPPEEKEDMQRKYHSMHWRLNNAWNFRDAAYELYLNKWGGYDQNSDIITTNPHKRHQRIK